MFVTPRLATLHSKSALRSRSIDRSKNRSMGAKPIGIKPIGIRDRTGDRIGDRTVTRSLVPSNSRGVTPQFPPAPYRSAVTPLPARGPKTRLKPLPNRLPIPQWLQILKKTERVSLILAGVLAVGALATYGWSMYSQQQWGKEYRRLDQLRRNERQLTTHGELMKNNIARTSDPKQYGLVPRSTDHIVVISPASPRPPLPMRAPGPDANAKPITPIGY
jgi:hypothetical protein